MVRRSREQTGLAEVQPLTAVLRLNGPNTFYEAITRSVYFARGAISCLAVPPLVRPRSITNLGFLRVQVLLAKLGKAKLAKVKRLAHPAWAHLKIGVEKIYGAFLSRILSESWSSESAMGRRLARVSLCTRQAAPLKYVRGMHFNHAHLSAARPGGARGGHLPKAQRKRNDLHKQFYSL